MLDVKKIRRDFPILAREVYGKPLVYLDNAASAQKPRAWLWAMDTLACSNNKTMMAMGKKRPRRATTACCCNQREATNGKARSAKVTAPMAKITPTT